MAWHLEQFKNVLTGQKNLHKSLNSKLGAIIILFATPSRPN